MSAAPAALLLAHRPEGRTLLIVGHGKLAAIRAQAAREAGMYPVVVWHGARDTSHAELQREIGDDAWHALAYDALFPAPDALDACEGAWDALFRAVDVEGMLFAVCITDTLAPEGADEFADRRLARCRLLARLCRARRLPLNVTDQPDLCDFSFPATHRFSAMRAGDATAAPSSLQIAVTTNGRGCRLAGRVRRTIVSSLPVNVGDAVERVGEMRDLAKQLEPTETTPGEQEDDPRFTNALGYQEKRASAQQRRMRWVAQISEYWPFERLARLGADEMRGLLAAQQDTAEEARPGTPEEPAPKRSRHELHLAQDKGPGRIYLLGSGPGHPGLLTVAAHHILTSPETDLVLSDKLVPTAVLALIPEKTPLVIAKKFPGNAEGAQSELIELATEAAQQGKTVVRLKQGDPYVYGRGGEEWVAFRKAGIECAVVPGISSALAGPLLVNIPVTQRGAADSLVLCTGVGRGGRKVSLPGYERHRTLLILMGVARLRAMVDALTEGGAGRAAFPGYVPIAVIERASSEDQRVIATTLDRIVDVIENRIPDGQRPPSMMVVGWAVLSLTGDVAGNGVTDDEEHCTATYAPDEAVARLAERDAERIERWLGGAAFLTHEGLPEGYRRLEPYIQIQNRDLGERSESGWAPPRYADRPTGGWTPAETAPPPPTSHST
ncbi:uroporphyrinogen-III C-methyltransferase [Malassezia obtusa]|uniref:precorrin-2 dehydrogenase n=1 Tax=Malassezia obtusa TaxID=76774 RepID=A0AAF0E1I7_9BASI|nr:uroporphyrinogen-III C-methyltransferase [Malassezia obtusa]